MVEPDKLWLVPFNTTVPPLAAKVPLVLFQFPATLKLPEGATNAPPFKVNAPPIVKLLGAVVVPPVIVKLL